MEKNLMPDWATAGAQVFVASRNGVRKVTIVKVTKAKVTCDNNGEYRLTSSGLNSRVSDFDNSKLHPLTDSSMSERYDESLMKGWAATVASRAQRFKDEPTEENAASVENAVSTWRRAVARVEANRK